MSFQNNINPYNQEMFEREFVKTPLFQTLKQDFDIISFDYSYDFFNCPELTPRQQEGQQIQISKFSAVPFYYINWLTEQNPKQIYDLGCGWNIFKKYIPTVIGIGPEPKDSGYFYGDIHDLVDSDFITHHQNYFESVFSINSLHFQPLTCLRKTVLDFISMIAPNGYGFLTLNCQRMLDREPTNLNTLSKFELENYIRTELSNIPVDYKVFDVDLTRIDNPMDGNIRLVCHKII